MKMFEFSKNILVKLIYLNSWMIVSNLCNGYYLVEVLTLVLVHILVQVYQLQVIQESIWLPGTDVHLLYRSSDGEGYKSTILIQLTPSQIPDTLLLGQSLREI